jgi:tetratricopeptide (TPR) repeat protein
MCKLALLIATSLGVVGGPLLLARAEEPTTARGFYERGHLHEQNKRYAEALADYSKAIEVDPQFVEAYFSRSSLYAGHPSLDKRDYGKAVADLTKILEIDPKDFSARFNRALAYESLSEYDKAIADYTKVIEGDTDFSRNGNGKHKCLAQTHHYRGRAYQWYKRDHPKAVADYTKALRLDPEIEMVHYRRGQAYNALKEYAKAVTDFTAALERDPDYPNLLCAYAWQLATCPDATFRDGKKALELAQKANQKFGAKVADQVEALAAAYAESGQFEGAVKWQKKAVELFAAKAKAYPDHHKAMQARLKQYEAGKPYRPE